MKPLTNEMLIEEIRQIVRDMDEEVTNLKGQHPLQARRNKVASQILKLLTSALQAKEEEMKEEIKSKKKYWHIRFEGISDPVISAERKKFNEEVSELINSVLDDLLSNLSK